MFKKNLNKHFNVFTTSLPTTKCCLKRSDETMLNRMRSGLFLREHKFRHNFGVDPNCPCGQGYETTNHFFLQCPRYNSIRHILTSIDQLPGVSGVLRERGGYGKVQLLIQGYTGLSPEVNKTIVSSVSRFMALSQSL